MNKINLSIKHNEMNNIYKMEMNNIYNMEMNNLIYYIYIYISLEYFKDEDYIQS